MGNSLTHSYRENNCVYYFSLAQCGSARDKENGNTGYGMKEGAYGGSRAVFKHNNMWGITHKNFEGKNEKILCLGLG